VTFSGSGVAERLLSFNNGAWHGSTDLVGAPRAASEWDFAEGSTLAAFSEYLTLQNPTASPVTVDLNYFTDWIGHPTRKLVLNPLSRTTVEVFSGTSAPGPIVNCVPSGSGASCGVGRGVQGVSVQVLAEGGAQVVAERPFYVNGLSFGSGSIYDGHVALGANAGALHWYFAEGTTLAGFNEFLTIQNPGVAQANLNISYQTDTGVTIARTYQVPPQSRATLQVWDGTQAGFGWGGVSAQVSANVPVVVERPMYMVHDFGAGAVAGATDVVGATAFAPSFAFAFASTLGSDRAFLTVQNVQGTAANLSLTYYLASGPKSVSTTVAGGSRKTIQVWDPSLGVGPGQSPVGVQIASSQPVLVEKPTYSSSPATYGATDTIAATS